MLLPFVALPYVIRTIGGERYGTIVFAQTIISYFVIFINFGMDVSAVKDVSVHRNDKERLNKVVSSVLLLKLLLFLLALVVLLFGIVFIPSLLPAMPIPAISLQLISALYIFAALVSPLPSLIPRNQFPPVWYSRKS